jgi:hypothetical protein
MGTGSFVCTVVNDKLASEGFNSKVAKRIGRRKPTPILESVNI